TMIAMGEVFGSSEAAHEENLLRGLAASGGIYEGPARRVAGPSEFDRIVQGDVLVTESTSEAFNILLPLLGAIVTDSGGPFSPPRGAGRRDARRHRSHPRWDTRSRGRQRGRSDGIGVTEVVALADAREDSRFGAKATGLGAAERAGLPIPPGIALSGEIVDAIAAGQGHAI